MEVSENVNTKTKTCRLKEHFYEVEKLKTDGKKIKTNSQLPLRNRSFVPPPQGEAYK